MVPRAIVHGEPVGLINGSDDLTGWPLKRAPADPGNPSRVARYEWG